jgi:hypothetical protein
MTLSVSSRMASAFENFEAPADPAPLSLLYPQFERAEVPAGIETTGAWIGELQPFSSDDCARAFLENVESDRPVWISGGKIREERPRQRHWANPHLVAMALPCRALVLLQQGPSHPRSFLLSPAFPEHYSLIHPHPRFDQTIEFEGRKFPGLCIYSAAEFQFDVDDNPIDQYLDQLTIYLAKHLIWLRTRELVRGIPPCGQVVRSLQPREELRDDKPVRIASGRGEVWEYWRGYWPGRSAASFNPQTHLANIVPDQECWCGKGLEYKACHRAKEAAMLGLNL